MWYLLLRLYIIEVSWPLLAWELVISLQLRSDVQWTHIVYSLMRQTLYYAKASMGSGMQARLHCIIILKLHLSVCVRAWEWEVTGSHSTHTEKFPFLWIARVGRYTKEPTDTTSNGTSPWLKEALCNSAGQKFDSRSKLTCGGLETANERDLGVEVVHGCLAEGGDSILRVFSWELLKMKLQDY